VHNVEFNLDALRSLGIPVVETRPVLAVAEEARRWAAEYATEHFPAHTPIIALNPSGTWESKRWGLEHFAQLGDALIERLGCAILLVWGPGELDDVRHIASLMRHEAIIPPANSLQQLAALFTHCTAMVSNDSGPMHIAAIMGTPTLGIFGPTNPLLQGPYSPRGRWILDATLALVEECHDV
jgi:ADP-heptose:LPS heptosyltransferase